MANLQAHWSRRKFIGSLTSAGSALMVAPLSGWTLSMAHPKVAATLAGSISIDTHNHIDVPFNAAEVPGPEVELSGEIKRSGLSAICMTFAVDRPALLNRGDAYERYKNTMDSLDAMLTRNRIKRCLTMAHLEAAQKDGHPTVIQSVEGGHFLEGKLERMEEAYKRGLRHFGLLHDNDASVPLGDVYTNPPRWGGLTSFGKESIKECNRLGILIDLAHANADTLGTALKLAAHPVIISHTGLDTQLGQNPNMAKMMKPRLISKELAKLVADQGGIIGVWTHLADSPIEYAQNIRALVEVIGVEHVCIGTDTKMTPSYRAPNPNQQSASAPGPERIGERTNLVWKGQTAGFYHTVADAMLKIGFSPDEITKIVGGNFSRVFAAATKQ
jgi:membrane dipeptidase